MKIVSKRILFAVGGLIFGLVAGFWGVLISGGGHFTLPVMLFISPEWFGLLLWPLWAFQSVRFDSKLSRILFIATMLAHFVGIVFHISDTADSEWFWRGLDNPAFFSALALYLPAQMFLWIRFARGNSKIDHATAPAELI